MRIKLLCLGLFLIVVCYSCSDKHDTTVDVSSPPYTTHLINWESINKSGLRNMSFPNWFSNKRIDSLNIRHIKLLFTNLNQTDTTLNIADTLPYQMVDFYFKENGRVKTVVFNEYSTGIKIAKVMFSYNAAVDSFGYSSPIASSDIKYGNEDMMAMVNNLQELQQYQRLVFIERDSVSLSYINKSSAIKEHHYFILDTNNWNVMFIDQHFKHQKQDVFYYGTPDSITAAFSIDNMVEKTNREKRNYYPTGVIKSQYFYNDVFVTKRYFNYDSLGFSAGFTDSLTTLDDKFIHAEFGVIKRNNELPSVVEIYNQEDTAKANPIKRITIDYTTDK